MCGCGTKCKLITLAVFVVLLAIVGQVAVELLNLGLGCASKTLCSAVFISNRDPATVDLNLECSNPAVKALVTNIVDRVNKQIVSSVGGLVTKTAIYSGPYRGCHLVYPGHPLPPESSTPRRVLDTEVEWPQGSRVTLDKASSSYKALDSALEKWVLTPEFDTRGIVVVKDGKIVYERYRNEFTESTALIGWSMTKSIQSTLMGILVKDGRLSLNSTFGDLLPEWKADNRSTITLNNLLKMESGLEWREVYAPFGGDVVPMLFNQESIVSEALKKPLQYKPGTHWYYSSGTSNILAWITRRLMGDDQAYWTLPARRLFDKIGAESMVLETDPSGIFVASSFSYATARDWSRFGLLYLQDGVWEGERILPEGWAKYSADPTDNAAHVYGSHWWLPTTTDKVLAPKWEQRKEWLRRLPQDAYWAHGYKEQIVMVIPSRNVVITRLGYLRVDDCMDVAAFVKDILSALE